MMVSVADEQGRLVLMGVDATYCVVDEVDTTASSLNDQYLQQVIREAEANAEEEDTIAARENEVDYDNPQLKAVIKETARNVIETTDFLLSSQIKHKNREACPPRNVGQTAEVTFEAEDCDQIIAERENDKSEASEIVKPPASADSSLLRAALLCRPVSLREPSGSRRLNFSLQKSPADQSELNRNVDHVSPETRSSVGDEVTGTTKPKIKYSKTKCKSSAASKTRPTAPSSALDTPESVAPKSDHQEAEENRVEKPKPKRCREKPYQCGECFRWFGCKSHVVEHMRTHTGEKPFECSLCNKRFSQKSNIYQHMNTHTKQRPFRCSDCGKDFMYRGSLYKHKRLHTGERPYTCGICERRFTHASQLFEHLRTHTNERPFKCGVCGRAFAHSGTMHRHQRNHFSQIKEKKVKRRAPQEAQAGDADILATKNHETVDFEDGKDITRDINHNSESYTPQMDQDLDKNRLGSELENQNGMKPAEDSQNNQEPPIALTASNTQALSLSPLNYEHQKNISAESSKTVTETGVKIIEKNIDFVSEVKRAVGNPIPLPQAVEFVKFGSGEVSTSQASSTSGCDTSKSVTSKQRGQVAMKTAFAARPKVKNFSEESAKPKRVRIETPDKKVFSCNVCGRAFCHKRSVKRHMQSNHPETADDQSEDMETLSATRSNIAMEVDIISGQEMGSGLQKISLLKSLLTLTTSNCNHDSDQACRAAELGGSSLGKASASLQAFAQICSQEHSGNLSGTPSAVLETVLSKNLKSGASHSESVSGEKIPSQILKLCIKVEPNSGEFPGYSENTVKDSTTLSASDDQDVLQNMAVKTEAADEFEHRSSR